MYFIYPILFHAKKIFYAADDSQTEFKRNRFFGGFNAGNEPYL